MFRKSLEWTILFFFGLMLVGLVISLYFIELPAQRGLVWSCIFGCVVGLITFSIFIVAGKSSSSPDSPLTVASLPDELSASALVVQLQSHGIPARTVGGYTSGFQTEIASDVKVVVPAKEYEAAMSVIKSSGESA